MKTLEHDEQVAIFQWAKWMEPRYPELALMHAIPNGGQRNVIVAAKLKLEGVKRGVLDTCLPVARKGYHGMYQEIKYGNNRLTEEQNWWKNELEKQGFYCPVAYSSIEGIENLKWYLDIKD